MDKEKLYIRYIQLQETVYLLKEDVVKTLQEFAGTESTDVRNRLLELASNINNGETKSEWIGKYVRFN